MRASKCGRRNLDNFSPNDRMQIAVHINGSLTLKPEPLDRPLRAPPNFVVVRPVINNRGVAIGDVGHVDRLINDDHVALGRDNGALEPFVSEIGGLDKGILIGTNVIIAVGPVVNSAAALETRFGRKRRPAYVVVTGSP